MILLSPDQAEEALLRAHLNTSKSEQYSIWHIATPDKLHFFDLKSLCHLIFIDMRFGADASFKIIRYLDSLQTGVALIALCRDPAQLQQGKADIHLLDDFVLTERLVKGELATRITHAIERGLKKQHLLHEKSLLQSLLDTIPDAIFFKDRESRFTKVNRAMHEIHKHSHDSIIGKSDFDLFSEEHARSAYKDEQEIIRTSKPVIAKWEKETFEDGQTNWVNTSKVPLKDSRHRIIGTMGISRNVTELKQAQDTLAQERTLLKTIVDHSLAGIFVKGLDGRYRLTNQRHVEYLGAESEAEVIGRTIHDFFKKSEAARISAADAKIMKTGRGIENMVNHRSRIDGPDFWLLTSKVPLHDENNRCIGIVGISLDVSEQKIVEKKLKTTIKTLEETKLQLIESEKLKTVGRLAAGIAHEVKNPLNVVSLGAEFLEDQIKEPEEIRQIVHDMREAVQKANDVIFELLDYAAPHKVKMKSANINDLIFHVLTLMQHNFNEARIHVTESLSDAIDPVRLDAPKMEQVFINLFLNAISVMEKGGTLTVRSDLIQMKSTGSNVSSAMTERFRIGDPIVQIEVLDSGSGLSPEEARKAFDPFYSNKATGEGAGLGLSVTRSIVEMHRGIMTLQNREDPPGACVRILLPAATNHKNDD